MDIREKIKELPASPGVYIMKGGAAETLYIGKSGNLKKRVSSYFYPGHKSADRISVMTEQVKDISYIRTSTEAEALIYENSLIKQLSPKYNVALKDGKSYPMLKLTAGEKFPRLFITRQKPKDGSIYYGPYTDVKLLRQALEILRQIFPLRTCKKLVKKVCLNYHIKQCPGPCEKLIDERSYQGMVAELKLFLDGKRAELLDLLSKKMKEASAGEDFEEAGRIKTRLEALGSITESTISYGPANELKELKDLLHMEGPLDAIEAFDISNIMGKSAVGSMVYFYKGRPQKSEYRKFLIKTVSAPDDYAMMREVVRRRYARLVEEKKALPDLIVIDGGKGHLSAALQELDALGIGSINVIGIAKEFEHIYLKDKNEPLILPKESKALHLLKRIRDEAHRFAINYHKGLMSKGLKASELDDIPGIGKKRKAALMKHFGDVTNMKTAGLDELLTVKGMNERSARNIIGYFKK